MKSKLRFIYNAFLHVYSLMYVIFSFKKHCSEMQMAIRRTATLDPKLPAIMGDLREIFRLKNPYISRVKETELFNIKLDLLKIRNEIKRDGIAVLGVLDESIVDEIRAELNKLEAYKVVGNNASEAWTGNIKSISGKVGRYNISRKNILSSQMMREFTFSEQWQTLGANLIGRNVIWDGVDAWWTFISDKNKADLYSQMYHSDRERLNFVKFFVYLTDVDLASGPHAYALKSHKKRPFSMRSDRRYNDTEVEKNFECLNITGKAGTVIVANTQGLHKGVSPTLTNVGRLILQIQVATSSAGHVPVSIGNDVWIEEFRKENSDKGKYFEQVCGDNAEQ
jgi:hypothetical protein